MARFIDAEWLDDIVDELNRNGYDISNATLMRGKIILSHIPTADVVGAVHGEWIKMDKRGNNVRCSKCGNTLNLRGVNAGRGDANYCPNCGADMRGETDEQIH